MYSRSLKKFSGSTLVAKKRTVQRASLILSHLREKSGYTFALRETTACVHL